jgi:sterol 3beta-glucosyltransferase
MRVGIIAAGSRGDVEPYLALAVGLARAGHGVRLVTHEDFAPLVQAQGIEFWPIGGRVQEIVQGAAMRERLQGGNFVAIMAQMAREARRGALEMARGGLAACQGMDLLLAGIGGLFGALALGEKLDIPLLQAYYIPFLPTFSYPSFLFSGMPRWLGGGANRLSYRLVQQLMWQAYRPGDVLARREALALPPAPFWGPFEAACTRDMPVLYGFSPWVIPPPADGGGRVHVTGYWLPEAAADWEPPAAVSAFLEAGAPPVYVGFGSMSSLNPAELAATVLGALARSGQRGIVLSGWGGLQAAELPESVLMVESIPFSWLFPRVAAVVHHGGAGTTAMGLRAGVPAVVVPFFGDQPYWGRRVAELGVGPAPIPRRALTVERLAQAIERSVGDVGLRLRAAELGARLRAEDGVGRAVAIIEGSLT